MSWEPKFTARNVLEDSLCDFRNATVANMWAGEKDKVSGFVVDLGCDLLIRKVKIRNSHNGLFMTGYAFSILTRVGLKADLERPSCQVSATLIKSCYAQSSARLVLPILPHKWKPVGFLQLNTVRKY